MSIHRIEMGLAALNPENGSLNGFAMRNSANETVQSGVPSFKSLLSNSVTEMTGDDHHASREDAVGSGSKLPAAGGMTIEQRLCFALLSGYGIGPSEEVAAAETGLGVELDASNPDLTAVCRVDAVTADESMLDNTVNTDGPELWNDFSYGGTNTPGGYLGESAGSFAVDANSGAIYFRKSDGAIGEKQMQPGDVVVDESGTTYAMASDGTVDTMSFYY